MVNLHGSELFISDKSVDANRKVLPLIAVFFCGTYNEFCTISAIFILFYFYFYFYFYFLLENKTQASDERIIKPVTVKVL